MSNTERFQLRGTFGGLPGIIDPARIQTLPEWHVCHWLGVNLVRNVSNTLKAEAAEFWAIDDRHTLFNFQLRKNVLDSTGRVTDASDWVATFKRHLQLDGPTHFPLHHFLDPENIVMESKFSFSIKLKKYCPDFLIHLSTPEFILVSQSAIQPDGAVDFRISTGPYLVELRTAESLVLGANTHSLRYRSNQAEEIELKNVSQESPHVVAQVEDGLLDFAHTSYAGLESNTWKTDTTVQGFTFEPNTAGYAILRASLNRTDPHQRLHLARALLNQTSTSGSVVNDLVPAGSAWSMGTADQNELHTSVVDTPDPRLPSFVKIASTFGAFDSGLEAWLVKQLQNIGVASEVTRLGFSDYVQQREILDEDIFIFKNGFDPHYPLPALRHLLTPESKVFDDPDSACFKELTAAMENSIEEQKQCFRQVSLRLLSTGSVVPIAFFGSTFLLRAGLSISDLSKSDDEVDIERVELVR